MTSLRRILLVIFKIPIKIVFYISTGKDMNIKSFSQHIDSNRKSP